LSSRATPNRSPARVEVDGDQVQVVPAPRTEDAAIQLAAQVAAHPPEAVARLKRMLHEWDGVVERTRAEGVGQVEWQRTGPGLPYGD
jgi:methylglutaconyl-CoA hydratase